MEKIDVRKRFGAEIKRRRAHLGISQAELAERADLHRTYVSDVEAGKRNPSLATIQRLAAALGASMSVIFGSADDPAAAQAHGAEASIGNRAVDLLLVEHNAKDVELTLAAFRKAKLSNHIQVVHDGSEALDFIFCRGRYAGRRMDAQPNVVLLRLQLPKVPGLEVLRRIKADQRTRRIPVVVLTASRKAEQIQEALRLGAEGYIIKPVNFQSFSELTTKLSFGWALLKPDVRSYL